MEKTLDEVLEEIDSLCPDTKSSERLFILAMIQDAYQDGYIAGIQSALKAFKEQLTDEDNEKERRDFE